MQVELNGSRQWVSIRGADVDNPVLLFLAGGPGGSQLATARYALGGLEDHFVVVDWEQPGAGKSFGAVKRSTLTPERYIEDAHALTLLLRERFGEEKIYVLGESWGSALGIMLVQRYPELFHAFIGTRQMVAFLETDLQDYAFALELARQRGDTAKVAKLTQQGPPPYYGKGVGLKQAAYLLDGYSYMNANPAITDNGFNTFRDLAAPEYGLYDKVNWARGPLVTLGIVYPQLWDVDFRELAPRLEVPVYFLIGRQARHQRAGRPHRGVLQPARCAAQGARLVRALRPHAVGFRVGPLRRDDGRHGPRADAVTGASRGDAEGAEEKTKILRGLRVSACVDLILLDAAFSHPYNMHKLLLAPSTRKESSLCQTGSAFCRRTSSTILRVTS